MNKIKIFDTTLRDGEQSPGCSMNIEQKMIIARMLDEAHVDVIEAGFAASNERDYEAIKMISKIVNYSTVTSLARCNKNDIDIAVEALKEAKHKRIHVFIATSDIHMEYKLKKTKKEIEQIVREMVSYAKSKCDDIEFSLEDATRTDKDFACKIIDIAIESGATTINIPDTVGYIMPFEFENFIKYLKENSKINDVSISVHCHNDLGMATANSCIAIKNGINQVECTINGIGERAGNTAMEEVVAILDTRKECFDAMTNIDTTKIYSLSKTVQKITKSMVQNNKPIVGKNAFLHEAGIHQDGVIKNRLTYEIIDPVKYGIIKDNIVIGIHSGKTSIIDKMTKMGYDTSIYNIEQIIFDIKQWFSQNENIDLTDEILINIINNNKRNSKIYIDKK